METITKAKKWGSSLGVIIPKEIVNAFGLQEEEELVIDVRPRGKTGVLRELWGKGKGRGERKTAQEWKDEFRRTLYREQ